MADNDTLHITNQRIDDAISQTRDIVEKSVSENKAIFNSLNAKMDTLDVKISVLSKEQKEITSNMSQIFFLLGATAISVAGIAIAVYLGFSKISISLTQAAIAIAQSLRP